MFLCSDDKDTKCSKLLRASLRGTSGLFWFNIFHIHVPGMGPQYVNAELGSG